MQLTISFKSQQNVVLPMQYNHILQGFIYNVISPELAVFFHDQGYEYEKRKFKLFTFSRILGNFKINSQKGHIVFDDKVKLVISSPVDEFCHSLANRLLFNKKDLNLGGNYVEVDEIEVDSQQVGSQKIVVKTLSPVVVYSTMYRPDGRKYTCYFQPGDPDYEELVEQNLRKKYQAFTGCEAPPERLSIRNLGPVKLHIVKYKETIIKGYSCKLQLAGPKELLQMAVDAGIGSKNSQGFGCVTIVKQKTLIGRL